MKQKMYIHTYTILYYVRIKGKEEYSVKIG